MDYIFKASFKDKPECGRCMLSGERGVDLNGETVIACYAIGFRPKCPEESCHRDCPLIKVGD